MKSKLNLELARSVHNNVLLFQRRMRKARSDYDFPVSNEIGILLTVLSGEKVLTATDISKALSLPKAKVSRNLIFLQESGYIEVKNSKSDRRIKDLSFTIKGENLLVELVRINNEISQRGIYPITIKQSAVFVRLLKGLNDGLGFPNVVAHALELPLLIERRRIAGASGMIGAEYMKTGLELAEYQILFELFTNPTPRKFTDLNSCLPLHISKMSRVLTAFSKKGYVRKLTLDHDKRELICELTDKGRPYFQKIDDQVAEMYLHALEKVAIKDVLEFIRLMNSLEGVPLPPPKQKEIELNICKSSEERTKSREVLVEILVEKKHHKNLTSELIPEDRFCLQYLAGGEVIGVLVISKRGIVEYFEIRSLKHERAGFVHDCYDKGVKVFYENFGVKSVQLPSEIEGRINL